ncbi:YitT family protein [Streptococcus orisratti]|uniref:YitT family protein n=1 Tax=Streptococcus orisratti TaxID=114652 RepID=UPI00036ED2F0|nr:YitT family protein [Streptococcus orisratti]
MQIDYTFRLKNFIFIALGAAIYAFGFVYFNMANKVAANGIAGLTLVFHALFGVNPTYSGYLINLPLVILGAYLFGRKAMVYTLEGIASLYFFIWLFQKIPLIVDLQQDYLVVSLIAGTIAGLGGGIVFRYGGTIGGSDIIARVIEDKFGIQLNQALLGFDIFVMILSLTYITIPQMMYALIASFMYSQVVNIIQNGGYSVRGMMIISDQAPEISQQIMEKLGRGVTYLKGEGAYSGKEKQVMYVAMSPQDVRETKDMIRELDPMAFVSVFSIDEVMSPEFVAARSKYKRPIKK